MQKCSTKFSSKKHYLIPSFGSDNCTLVCTAIVATLTVQSVLTSRTGSYKYVLCEMLVTQTYYNNRDKVIWYSVQCVLQHSRQRKEEKKQKKKTKNFIELHLTQQIFL